MSFSGHQGKRRKIDSTAEGNSAETRNPSTRFKPNESDDIYAETWKPSVRFKPAGARDWTISVAIPSSVIADCKTAEQRINSPSRLARALAVFAIDEVVVFDDSPMDSRPPAVDTNSYTGDIDPAHYIFHLLSYMETPPFMRKSLFPLHPNLRLQGLLPSLDMPHHPHKDEQLPYMEGMTISGKPANGKGTLVDIGMRKPISIQDSIPPMTRVTLQFPNESFEGAEPVDPSAPRTEAGYYWGYQVRKASSLTAVFEESPHEDGYDICIGTSERGITSTKAFPHGRQFPFNHLLIVFGGPRGLEYAATNDPQLSGRGIHAGKVRELFDHWVNVLPHQGSRTIRTDEAVFIALTDLRRLWASE